MLYCLGPILLAWINFNTSMDTDKNHRVRYSVKPGVWLLSQFPPFRYFPHFSGSWKHRLFLSITFIFDRWRRSSAAATLVKYECNRHFCKIRNFAYGEINERSFSNPHPRTPSDIAKAVTLRIEGFCLGDFWGGSGWTEYRTSVSFIFIPWFLKFMFSWGIIRFLIFLSPLYFSPVIHFVWMYIWIVSSPDNHCVSRQSQQQYHATNYSMFLLTFLHTHVYTYMIEGSPYKEQSQ